MQKSISSKRSCPQRPQEEHASPSDCPKSSREMHLKDRISLIRNPYLPTYFLSFLSGLLTPILSLRSVILLGRCREERCKT